MTMISRTMMMLLPFIGGLMLQDVAILVTSFPTSPLSRMKPQQSSSSSTTPLAPLRPSSSQLAMRSMSVVLGKQEQQQIPKLGKNGLYLITNEEEYRTLLNHNADKLIVLKVFAPWCKTCKALEPKFQALARGLSATNGADVALPIIWAELPHSKRNKDFVKSVIGVSALPSVQLYAGNGMKVDTFPCGPSKVSTILKPKLSQLILEHVDMPTKQLKVIVTKNKQGENISVNNKDTTRLHHFQHPLRFWASIYNMIRLKLRTIFIVYQYRRKDDAITSF
mmetsp:Transcript_6477/g.6374  ORF Transcript_6477/g.6374 Transcript_6477/m.6374 type:complete len:279 (+) Transcript_6477:247-1083(+)